LILSFPSFSQSHPNAKSPDVPGGVDIAITMADVSPYLPEEKDVDARHKAGHEERKRS
jgi:hypothetical protein